MKRRIKKSLSPFVVLVTFLMIIGFLSAVPYGDTGNHSINPVTSTSAQINKLSNMAYVPAISPSPVSESNQVNVFQEYSKEPAPMGIADYGIGYNGAACQYNTTSFLGIVNISSLQTLNSSLYAPSEMTFQLNINLVFNDGTTQYVYWVQNVADLNTSSGNHMISFIDNIWNQSASKANMHNSTILGNGTVANSSGTNFYYDYASSSLPGNNAVLQYHTNLKFKIVSIMNGNNQPEVVFMYNDGYGWITYDNVVFKFVNNLTANYGFVVDGYTYEPDGYSYYDAELILGGPGGGSKTNDTLSNLHLQLEYWNGHNFQQVINAFNFGSDTAEGIQNVVSTGMYNTNDGTLFANVINGTGTLGQIYSKNCIGIVNMSTSLSSGALKVNGTSYYFINGDVNVTLAPGYYDLQLYNSNGFLVAQGNFSLKAGEYLPLIASTKTYTVSFTESNLPAGMIWYLNLSSGQSFSSSTNTITFAAPNGTYSYTIATSDKTYSSFLSSNSFSVNGSSITNSVSFSEVKYTLTFSESGLPSGSTWSITLNGTTKTSTTSTISFSEINGTYAYTIATTDKTYSSPLSSGSLSLSGGSLYKPVSFIEVKYTVTFNESGLSSNTIWYVNLSNGIKSGPISGTTFSFYLTNGTYSFTVANTTGYSISVSSGSISVNGNNLSKTVTFTPNNTSPLSNMEIYSIIGGIVIVAAIAGAVAMMRKRK